ncbi:unnamed protein product [Amoebophrya sp. A120]|nr:unnamed protein product [Amoebophrya sp. A120]|eukprot:GSA120T00017529001.1
MQKELEAVLPNIRLENAMSRSEDHSASCPHPIRRVYFVRYAFSEWKECPLDPLVVELQCYKKIFEDSASLQQVGLSESVSRASEYHNKFKDEFGTWNALASFYRTVELCPTAYPSQFEFDEGTGQCAAVALPYCKTTWTTSEQRPEQATPTANGSSRRHSVAVLSRANLYTQLLPSISATEISVSAAEASSAPASEDRRAPSIEVLRNVEAERTESTRLRESLLLELIRTDLAAAVTSLCWGHDRLFQKAVAPAVNRSLPHWVHARWHAWTRKVEVRRKVGAAFVSSRTSSSFAAAPSSTSNGTRPQAGGQRYLNLMLAQRVADLLRHVAKPHLSIVLDLALFSVLHVLFQCLRKTGLYLPSPDMEVSEQRSHGSKQRGGNRRSPATLHSAYAQRQARRQHRMQQEVKKNESWLVLRDQVVVPWASFYETMAKSLSCGTTSSGATRSKISSTTAPGFSGSAGGSSKIDTFIPVRNAWSTFFSWRRGLAWWWSLEHTAEDSCDSSSSDEWLAEEKNSPRDGAWNHSNSQQLSSTSKLDLLPAWVIPRATALCQSGSVWLFAITALSLRLVSLGKTPLAIDQIFSIEENESEAEEDPG